MIFDAHAHYDDEAFDVDRENLLIEMHRQGVCGIVNNAVDLETSKFGIEYSKKYPFMWTTVGYHPEKAPEASIDYLTVLESLSKEEKVVAIGEIGLDYHYSIPKDIQIKVFEEQLKLANSLNIPVVIHDREAHGDILEILKKYRPKGLIHCFSGSVEMLREILKLGLSISLGGAVTFKNAKHPVEIAREVPLDKLLLETDAPYMTPVPFRGKRCNSLHIKYTAEKIASIKGISSNDVLKAAYENALRLYNIDNRA